MKKISFEKIYTTMKAAEATYITPGISGAEQDAAGALYDDMLAIIDNLSNSERCLWALYENVRNSGVDYPNINILVNIN